jgi:hypothetical protein
MPFYAIESYPKSEVYKMLIRNPAKPLAILKKKKGRQRSRPLAVIF